MKKVYVTITGMKYYYGFNPFSIGKKLTCKKEHNNPYDSEAIKVTMKNIGTVGYIANSPYTKANGTMGAGAVNKYVRKKFKVRVMFMTSTKRINIPKKKPNRQTKLRKNRLLSFDCSTGVHRTSVGNNTNYGFNFARIACNRVHCTRTGEHGVQCSNIVYNSAKT